MRGLIRVFVVAVMAIGAGCLSWSRQQYETRGGTEPPRVQHSSWSVGVLPARSPVEAASADAIGTDARARMKYGYAYGGGYGYGGYVPPSLRAMSSGGSLEMSHIYPIGAPANQVLRFYSDSRLYTRIAVNGQAAVGMIEPGEERYIVSPSPYVHKIVTCGYDSAGNYMGKRWRPYEVESNPESVTYYRIRDFEFRRSGGPACPF